MNSPVHTPTPLLLSRRDVVQGGLFLGAAAALGGLAGCQTTPRPSTRLPNTVWPDGSPNLTETPTKVHAELPPPLPGLPPGVIARTAWTSAKPNRAYVK